MHKLSSIALVFDAQNKTLYWIGDCTCGFSAKGVSSKAVLDTIEMHPATMPMPPKVTNKKEKFFRRG